VVLVDLHAEATSEKVALGWHLDGRVTAVLGTHTHVPTADEQVLPGGTAVQTDVGMTGPYAGVIGVQKELIVQKFLTNMPSRFEPASDDVRLCGALIDCDPATGRAGKIERILLRQE
jgi:2',3'-cyclic-nucleotide 2'-phosphodiesterase